MPSFKNHSSNSKPRSWKAAARGSTHTLFSCNTKILDLLADNSQIPEDIEQLPRSTQRELLSWLEIGAPGSGAGAPRVRWIATLQEEAQDSLDPELRRSLGGLTLRLPPLRERLHAIRRIAAETARAWCAQRQEPPRRFAEDALTVMDEYPWPGNLRELEALVVQSLAASGSDPLRADDLQLEGAAFAPLLAGEIGTLIEEGEAIMT